MSLFLRQGAFGGRLVDADAAVLLELTHDAVGETHAEIDGTVAGRVVLKNGMKISPTRRTLRRWCCTSSRAARRVRSL
jgi:hypothetical protein